MPSLSIGANLRAIYSVLLLSLILLPQAKAETVTAFEIPQSSVHQITSEKLGRSYDLYVKLPVGYDAAENANHQYPVIYLNDGPYTFQVASGSLHLPMGGSHKFERAILVGISFAYGENGMDSRVRDLTPWEDKDWKRYKTGGGLAYLDFLENQVIPFVEKNYRAAPNKRVLSGQSLGGSFGAWVMLHRPELFSAYILTSPSLWFKDKQIFDLEAAYARNNKDLPVQVYFAVGEREVPANGNKPMKSQMLAFVKSLEARHYPSLKLKYEVIPGSTHEITFPQAFLRGAQWLFER